MNGTIRRLRGHFGASFVWTLALVAGCTDAAMAPRTATRAAPQAPSRTAGVAKSTVLGSLGGDPALTVAFAINENGVVVGQAAESNGLIHAFLWTAGSGMRDLGALGDKSSTSSARAVNASGMVAGQWTDGRTGVTHAFLWTATGGMQDLGPSGMNSVANGINSLGQIVGTVSVSKTVTHAYLWNPQAKGVDLGISDGTSSEGLAINASGQIVGIVRTSTSVHAFLWSAAAGMIDPTAGVGPSSSDAVAINDAGQIVGTVSSAYETLPYLWTASGGVRILSDLSDPVAVPTAIDSRGEAVGTVSPAALRGQGHAFYLAADGHSIQDVDDPNPMPRVSGINDAHQMVGGNRIVTLTPYPIPVATPLTATTWENVPVVIKLPAPTALDKANYIYSISTPPSGATITVKDSTALFTPAIGQTGVITLNYGVLTNYGPTGDANTITITVNRAQPPSAPDLPLTVPAGGTIQIPPPGVDPQGESPLSYNVHSTDVSRLPVGGEINTSSTPWTYTAPAGFTGVATFEYTVINPSGLSSGKTPGTITITVGCPNGTIGTGINVSCAPVVPAGPGGPNPPNVCTPGTFGQGGLPPCTPAPAGSFVAISAATSATPCPAGMFQSQIGQSSCVPAPAGSFASTPGSTAATPCPAGTYQPTPGGSRCIPTLAGTYTAAGASAPTPCALGTYEPYAGQTSCLPAPLGTYVDAIGQEQALPCAAGLTTRALGSSSATACVAFNASEVDAHVASDVTAGSLVGVGSSAASTLNDFLNKIDLASGEIANGQTRPACNHLYQAYAAMDPSATTHVTGAAAPTIAAELKATYAATGCVAIMPNPLPF